MKGGLNCDGELYTTEVDERCCSVFVGPNRCKLQDMLANLRDAEDLSSIQPPVAPPVRPNLPRLNEHQLGRTDEGNPASNTISLW